MQNLQRHAPQMKEIQKKYKGDRQEDADEELMKFYKENNINPAASCLPLLAQFPVFISLYLRADGTSRSSQPGDEPRRGSASCRTSPTRPRALVGLRCCSSIYARSQIASTYFMSATMDKTQRIM